MSRMKMGEFVESLELALLNIHASVERGGVYGILMGNLRRNGEYFNLSSLVERVAPGKLIDEIIKVQHNCVSDSRDYRGNIVKIGHEKLLCFRVSGPALFLLSKMENRAAAMVGITWRAAVRRVLQGGKVMHLKEIERELQPYIETRSNNNADAKIRQICQDDRYFVRTAPGTYKLAA